MANCKEIGLLFLKEALPRCEWEAEFFARLPAGRGGDRCPCKMADALKKSGKTNVWLLFCFILSVRDASHSRSSGPFSHVLLDWPFLQLP